MTYVYRIIYVSFRDDSSSPSSAMCMIVLVAAASRCFSEILNPHGMLVYIEAFYATESPYFIRKLSKRNHKLYAQQRGRRRDAF